MRIALLYISFLIVGSFNLAHSQQEPLFQHNYLNPFVYNPAYAGSNDQTEIGAFRNQKWANFDGGIISNLINIHSRINQSNSSIGLQLNTDNIGLSARTKAHLSYAYRIKISDDFFFQPGFSVGIVDQRINYSGIVADFADPILSQTFNPNRTGIDANFGIFMKYKDFKFGLSVPQLLGNKLLLTETSSQTYQLERQYMANTTYTFFTSDDRNFFVQPDLLLIYSPGLPFHYSASLLTGLTKIGWIGATYKSGYAVGANIGLSLFEQLKIGFAYDIPLGDMANISNSNNMEIGVVYQFGTSSANEKPSKSQANALENRLRDVVRQQEIKDSIYSLTVDSLNTEINIKQLENKVLADENILIKDNSISVISDTAQNVANNNSKGDLNTNPQTDTNTDSETAINNGTDTGTKIGNDKGTNTATDTGTKAGTDTETNTDNNNPKDGLNGGETSSTGEINDGKNIKVNQTTPVDFPVGDMQTQSIKIKDDFFTEVLNSDEAPDGYYVVTGMYDSKAEADQLLLIAKTKFDSPKILVNKRNDKYYVVLYYSENINGVIEALMVSNNIKADGFSRAWALNYFKRR